MLPFPISFFLSLLVNAFLRLHLVLPYFSSGIRFASLFPVQFTIFIFQKSLLCSIENTFALCASYVWHRSYYLLRLREWSEVLEIKNYYWKSSPKPLSLYVMSLNAVGCRWSGWSRWCQRFWISVMRHRSFFFHHIAEEMRVGDTLLARIIDLLTIE